VPKVIDVIVKVISSAATPETFNTSKSARPFPPLLKFPLQFIYAPVRVKSVPSADITTSEFAALP
jgi:hypothetical protein